MVNMAVHPAVRKQTEQMKARSVLLHMVHRRQKRFIPVKFAFANGNVDPR